MADAEDVEDDETGRDDDDEAAINGKQKQKHMHTWRPFEMMMTTRLMMTTMNQRPRTKKKTRSKKMKMDAFP